MQCFISIGPKIGTSVALPSNESTEHGLMNMSRKNKRAQQGKSKNLTLDVDPTVPYGLSQCVVE